MGHVSGRQRARPALGIAHRHGVDIGQVTLGNGSNDVLVLLAEAFLVPGVEAVYSQYAFAVYPVAVQASGATARVVPAWLSGHAQPLGHNPSDWPLP